MGGLVFDVDDPSSVTRIFPPGVDRLTLTPTFIAWCLEEYSDIIPRITESDIKDKSKADGLVKSIACLQALWFCLQFITRMAQRLPVTLLELNTFAHSVCAVLIYFLWWEKPMDVDEPVAIPVGQSAKVRSLAAWAAVHSALGFHEMPRPSIWRFFKIPYLRRSSTAWQNTSWLRDSVLFCLESDHTPSMVNTWRDKPVRLSKGFFHRLPEPVSSFPSQTPSRPLFYGLDGASDSCEFVSYDPPILYVRRGTRIPGAISYVAKANSEIDESLVARLNSSSCLENVPPASIYLSDWPLSRRARNLAVRPALAQYHFREFEMSFSLEQLLAIILTGLFYGGLHALAYGLPLRSRAETLCWQISCLTVACFGPFVAIWSNLTQLNYNWASEEKSVRWQLHSIRHYVFVGIELPAHVLYVLSRIFLVVEVFLSLPYVDPGVFQTPNWSIYFPHIG